MDNSQTWIVHGPSESMAFNIHEAGYDIFLGNFRGTYPRKTADWKSQSTYWNYTLDDLAEYDVKAFIEGIIDIKVKELMLNEEYKGVGEQEVRDDIANKLEITYIGHSMGGMTLPMYVI